ncbi:MAG: hypothetical protein CL763_04575 [Chloroflexi bacterium]|nr:hypothetical protein [Chloroflexota bacterium]
MNNDLDIITFEVITARLDGIVREMENAVFRTGYSTIVRESHDFSCGLLDARGRLVARGSHPGHMGGLPVSIDGLFEFYEEGDFQEGDAYLASHPYYSGCPHANDMVVMTPIFAGSQLIAFAASIGHTPDTGGVSPGTRNSSAHDLFGEGLIIPPVRFMRNYQLVQDIETFIRGNSRVPSMMVGDLVAKAGVCHTIGEARLKELADIYGLPAIFSQFQMNGEKTTYRIQEQIKIWPDGVSAVEAWVDDPATDEQIRLHVAAYKEGSNLILDFSKTGNQSMAPINLRPAFIEGLARNAVIRLTDRYIPLNWGVGNVVKCLFSKGSLVDPVFPGPVGFYSKTLALVESVIGAVMAKASGNRALAHIATQSSIVVGYEGERNRQYVQYELMYAGSPGWDGGDGFTGIGSRASYAKLTSCEVIESEFPVEMLRFEVIPDTAGDGKFRGGPGYIREYQVHSKSRLSGGAARRRAAGVEGGENGSNAFVVINPGTEKEERYPGIVSNIALFPGDVFRIETGGGGGVFSPSERSTERIENDIEDGILSAEKAKKMYSFTSRMND